MPLTRRSKTIIIAAFAITIMAAAVAGAFFYLNRKLCENNDEVFHIISGKCYKKGLRGPCNDTLVIQADRKQRYGICDCPYTDHDRTLLYHRETAHCYFVFSQGFCEDGFWLTVTEKGEPVCEENKCLSEFENSEVVDEIVPIKGGKCAILHQTAEDCEEDQVVRFHRNYIHPSCKSPPVPLSGSISVPPSKCPVGSYQSIMGLCTPTIEMDF